MIPHGMDIEKYRHDAARQQQAKRLAAAARSIAHNENVAVGAHFALAATENYALCYAPRRLTATHTLDRNQKKIL